MTEQTMELTNTDDAVEIDENCTTEDESNDVPQVPEQFAIRDAASASWLARKLNECRAHSRRVRAWADKEIKRAERDEQFLMMRYGQQLQDFAVREISRLRGRRRSICLPGGTIGFRHVGPTLVFDDPAAVLRWAKASCPSAVVTKESVSKTAVNSQFAETGELPDGAHVEVGRDRFYIS